MGTREEQITRDVDKAIGLTPTLWGPGELVSYSLGGGPPACMRCVILVSPPLTPRPARTVWKSIDEK